MDRIEEVKKILRNGWPRYEGEIKYDNTGKPFSLDTLDEEVAQQICQLFPKTEDNPDGCEPPPDDGGAEFEDLIAHSQNKSKADGGRLLEEPMTFLQTANGGRVIVDTTPVLKLQDAKTASIKGAECQERVERIFKEIENKVLGRIVEGSTSDTNWQALKKQEGVK